MFTNKYFSEQREVQPTVKFDSLCKQVKGMKPNENRKGLNMLKLMILFLYCSLIREKNNKRFSYKYLNICISKFSRFQEPQYNRLLYPIIQERLRITEYRADKVNNFSGHERC